MFIEEEETTAKFYIPTGCTTLDCVLGGGYAGGRIINLIGDKGSSKTGLMIEACANFHRKFPNGNIYYHESEAAFDFNYASRLGLPEKTIFVCEEETLCSNLKNNVNTIEGLFEVLEALIASEDTKTEPSIYIVDSLDFLSDMAELGREMGQGSYGTKAKMLSQFFRTLTKKMRNSNITLFIISQVRDNLTGGIYGAKFVRSGGKALDHACSQILWLSEVGKIIKTIDKIERKIGINIKAHCTKNKVGKPFRDCVFPYLFEYGSDSVSANIEWLNTIGALTQIQELLGTDYKKAGSIVDVVKKDKGKIQILDEFVRAKWAEIEVGFSPEGTKYS